MIGTAVLTGGTTGIGRVLAERLGAVTGRLIVHGPQPSPNLGFRHPDLYYVQADYAALSSLSGAATSIQTLAPKIDLLINNAAAPGAPDRRVTVDGHERTLQVNAIAPARLTGLLRPALHPGARIVNVGSGSHGLAAFDFADLELKHGYDPVAAYARSKLALIAWSLHLAELLQPAGIDVVTVDPGLNRTPLSSAMAGHIGGPPSNGAARVFYAATTDVPTGSYLVDDQITRPSAEARNADNQRRISSFLTEDVQ
jgi:NAD(P)-dependent dehydrogenase (short-subunit alcohol dehydrogenase family)